MLIYKYSKMFCLFIAVLFISIFSVRNIWIEKDNNVQLKEETERCKLIYITSLNSELYYSQLKKYIDNADDRYDTNTEILRYAGVDEKSRYTALLQALAQKPDGIILDGFVSDKYLTKVKEKCEEKTLIVFIDTVHLFSSSQILDRWCYSIGIDDYMAGYSTGKLLAEKLNGKGKVGILAEGENLVYIEDRIKGFKKALERYPKIEISKILYSGGSLEIGMSLTQQLLEKQNIDAIWGVTANDILAVANVIKKQKKDIPLLLGYGNQDAIMQYVKEEIVYATIAPDQEKMINKAVEVMKQDLDGIEYIQLRQSIPYIVVKKDNVQEYLKLEDR